jgi:hypothetical protein
MSRHVGQWWDGNNGLEHTFGLSQRSGPPCAPLWTGMGRSFGAPPRYWGESLLLSFHLGDAFFNGLGFMAQTL